MSGSIFEFGPFRLDAERRELRRGGESLALTPKVLDTLIALVERRGRVAEKRELMGSLWPDHVVEEANLTQNVFTLRKVLGDREDGRPYIVTVRRRGYRFEGDVRELESPDAAGGAPSAIEPAVRRPADRKRLAGGLLAAAILVAAAFCLSPMGNRSPARAQSPVRSLAVLPIANLSGDTEQDYLADGITDALITDLGRSGPFRVISRTSSMHYKGTRRPLGDIARELGVHALVEGSVARSGDRVRVTARLVDGRTDRQLWARSYERRIEDVLELQAELARLIVRELADTLGEGPGAALDGPVAGPPPGPKQAIRPAAYEAYLRGQFHLNRRTEDELWRSVAFFERARQIEPTYAAAHAGLASAYALLGNYGYGRSRDAFPRAKAAADRALALDETLGAAHATLGFVLLHFDWDWSAAESSFRAALAQSPNSATARHWYAELLSAAGRHDEAIAQIRLAHELDPLSVVVQTNVARILYLSGRDAEAIEEARRAVDRDSGFVWAHAFLALALSDEGRHGEALPAAAAAGSAALKALVLARAGRLREARDLLPRLEGEIGNGRLHAFYLAEVHAAMGSRGEAIGWLERALREKEPLLIFAGVDPPLAGLKGEARFRKLLANIGHPSQAGPGDDATTERTTTRRVKNGSTSPTTRRR